MASVRFSGELVGDVYHTVSTWLKKSQPNDLCESQVLTIMVLTRFMGFSHDMVKVAAGRRWGRDFSECERRRPMKLESLYDDMLPLISEQLTRVIQESSINYDDNASTDVPVKYSGTLHSGGRGENGMDGSKNIGFVARENGRYGSHPVHDRYDEESGLD